MTTELDKSLRQLIDQPPAFIKSLVISGANSEEQGRLYAQALQADLKDHGIKHKISIAEVNSTDSPLAPAFNKKTLPDTEIVIIHEPYKIEERHEPAREAALRELAVEILLRHEDARGVTIVTGEKEKLATFFEKNPGLRNRFIYSVECEEVLAPAANKAKPVKLNR